VIFVLAFDSGFAMATGVAARSLDRFLTSTDRIVLLHDNVAPGALRDVCSCITSATPEVIDCSSMFNSSWTPASYLTRASFLRFLAPQLLPDASRAVYLDGDVVVRRDPRALHDADLNGRTLGAVRSRVTPFFASSGGVQRWQELGVASNSPYFNAGVLVIDLDRWRKLGITDRATNFLAAHGTNTLIADQEALNVAAVDDWTHLDLTWNYVTHIADNFLQQPDLEPSDPHIIHYAGRAKPWVAGRQPLFAEDWHQRLLETPWAAFEPAAGANKAGLGSVVRRWIGRMLRVLRNLARET